MRKLYLTLLILLFSISYSFGAIENIKPESIGDTDTWDSTGSGSTKTIRITDKIPANYIFTPTDENIDRYELTDLANALSDDTIDSIVITVTAQDNGSGNNRMLFGVRIGTDQTVTDNLALTTSWVEYSLSVTTPPGSRGTWDDFEIDSLVGVVQCKAIGGSKEVRVTEFTVLVFYTPDEMNIIYPNEVAGCKTGTDFGEELVRRKPFVVDTIESITPATEEGTDYFTTRTGVPNNSAWETGGFRFYMNVTKNVGLDSVKVRINRMNSDCTAIEESTPYTTVQNISGTGEKVIVIAQHNWTDGSTADLMQIELVWSNPSGEATDELFFLVGDSNVTRLETEVTIGGVALKGPDDCATVDTLIPDLAVDPANDLWEETDLGGDKVHTVTDNDTTLPHWIDEINAGHVQAFSFTEPTIAAGDAVSHFFIELIADKSGGGRGQIFSRMRMTDNANFCDGSLHTMKQAMLIYADSFDAVPSGNQLCAGTLDSASLDSIEVYIIAFRIPTGTNELRVAEVNLIACYTAADGEILGRRRKINLMGKNDIQKQQELATTGQLRFTIIFGKPKKWIWSG